MRTSLHGWSRLCHALCVGLLVLPCDCVSSPTLAARASASPTSASLVEPVNDIAGRDLLHGPGGAALAPALGARFRFRALDETGVSPGVVVEDGAGLVWDVKLGREVKPEIAASRLVWGAGFHQPPLYYVGAWHLEGGPAPGPQPEARFRPELPAWREIGEWSWSDNPFVGTRELRALYVMMALLNNWDLKPEQNAIYAPADGAPYRYVVKDLGASLGQSGWLQHTKNDVEGFEREPFIRAVRGREVELYLRVGYLRDVWQDRRLGDGIRVDDVRWLCSRLAALSDQQWSDAFRAGGYPEPQAQRFIARLRAKVQEGMQLREPTP
jgi:hypothetical protein